MNEDGEDEEFLGTKKVEEKSSSSNIPLCGCLSVQYYRPFFDIDTKDVYERLVMSSTYCRKDDTFYQLIKENPDAYGPFWIATILIFTIAVTSHISSWISSWIEGNEWVYNFEVVLTAASMIYSFLSCVPLLLWFIMRQFDAKLTLIQALCLYGYSLVLFIPAAAVCLVPFPMTDWLSMLGAALASALFLVRNVSTLVVTHAKEHAMPIFGGLVLTQFIFCLSIKITFFG